MNKENYENQNEVSETKHIEEEDFYLTEESFYPPADNRCLQSLIEDINNIQGI